MGNKITIPVTDASAKPQVVPDHFKLADSMQLALGQLGDGLFAFSGTLVVGGVPRATKDLNGEVIAGTGLQVKVRDFVGLINGVVLGDKNKEQFDPSRLSLINVSAGTSFVVLVANRVVGSDGFDRPDFDRGVVSIDSAAPGLNSGKILLAKLDIPTGTTQVVASMIDNSVKDYLKDMDEVVEKTASINGRLDGLDAAVLDLQTRVSILGGDVVALGSQVTATSAEVASLQSTVSGLSTTVATQQVTIDALNTSVAALSTKTDGIEASIASLSGSISVMSSQQALFDGQIAGMSAALIGTNAQVAILNSSLVLLQQSVAAVVAGQVLTSGSVTAIQDQVTATNAALSAIQAQVSGLQTAVNDLVAQGLKNLSLTVQGNIALVNFKVDSLSSAIANSLFNGFSDLFVDTSGLDLPQSHDYAVTSNGLIKVIPTGAPTVANYLARWGFDGVLTGDPSKRLYNGGPVSFVPGVWGQAVSLPVGSGLNSWGTIIYPGENGSASFFVNPGAVPGFAYLLMLSGANGLNLYINGGTLYLSSYNQSNVMMADAPLAMSTFTHLVLTWSTSVAGGQTTVRLFVNGVGQTPVTLGHNVLTSCFPQGAAVKTHTDYATASIIMEELAIYPFVLSQAQITQNGTISGASPDGVVMSKLITASVSPSSVLLVSKIATGVVPTDLGFEVSRDNGTTWMPVVPNAVTSFTTEPAGTSLRVRSTLKTPQAALRAMSLWWA